MQQHPIYTDYYCDSKGNVYSTKRDKNGIMLSQQTNHKGYKRVPIQITSHKRRFYNVGRFVLECYQGVSELEVDHINRVRGDNRIVNLRYVTRSENMSNTTSRPVWVTDTLTNTTIKYDSTKEVAKQLKTTISNVNKQMQSSSNYKIRGRYIASFSNMTPESF